MNLYKTDQGLLVRNAGEEGVRDQQVKEYKCIKPFLSKLKNHIFLDLGGHVGWFIWYIKTLLPECRVISVEMCESTFEILQKNWEDNSGVTLLRGAVGDVETEFFYPGRKYTSGNSMIPVRGRKRVKFENPCPSLDFSTLVNTYSPSVIKMDIEGSEFFLDLDALGDTQLIFGELHHSWKGYLEKQRVFIEKLLSLGYKPIIPPNLESCSFFGVCNFCFVSSDLL